MLTDPDLAAMLLENDENEKGGAFSHWSKFQIILQQGKTPEGIRWNFMAVCLVDPFNNLVNSSA